MYLMNRTMTKFNIKEYKMKIDINNFERNLIIIALNYLDIEKTADEIEFLKAYYVKEEDIVSLSTKLQLCKENNL